MTDQTKLTDSDPIWLKGYPAENRWFGEYPARYRISGQISGLVLTMNLIAGKYLAGYRIAGEYSAGYSILPLFKGSQQASSLSAAELWWRLDPAGNSSAGYPGNHTRISLSIDIIHLIIFSFYIGTIFFGGGVNNSLQNKNRLLSVCSGKGLSVGNPENHTRITLS